MGAVATAAPTTRFRAAERFLSREGERGATVYRVDQIRNDLAWVAYVGPGADPRTVIVTGGGPATWSALRYLEGWPCPPVGNSAAR